MAKLIFLGTASAVSSEGQENSFLAVQGEHSAILVDCSIKPVRRLREAGIDFNQVSDLIITHFHPDHVGGLPNLLMDMWLLGRMSELRIHGCGHAISRAKVLMDLFDWESWTGLFPVSFHALPEQEMALVLETAEFRIMSSPVAHMIPTLGLRMEHLERGFTLAYSADTRPVEAMVRLGAGADVLIHEAAGAGSYHSSAAQAGEIAARAGAGTLYLTHYSLPGDTTSAALLSQAKKTFPGKVVLAEDLMEIPFLRSITPTSP